MLSAGIARTPAASSEWTGIASAKRRAKSWKLVNVKDEGPPFPSRAQYTSAFFGTIVVNGRASVIQAAQTSPLGSRVSAGFLSMDPTLARRASSSVHFVPSQRITTFFHVNDLP